MATFVLMFLANISLRSLPTYVGPTASMHLTGPHVSVNGELQEGILHDLTQRRMDPILTPGEIRDSLAMCNRLDQWCDEE